MKAVTPRSFEVEPGVTIMTHLPNWYWASLDWLATQRDMTWLKDACWEAALGNSPPERQHQEFRAQMSCWIHHLIDERMPASTGIANTNARDPERIVERWLKLSLEHDASEAKTLD